jgi:hypothetical protein
VPAIPGPPHTGGSPQAVSVLAPGHSHRLVLGDITLFFPGTHKSTQAGRNWGGENEASETVSQL